MDISQSTNPTSGEQENLPMAERLRAASKSTQEAADQQVRDILVPFLESMKPDQEALIKTIEGVIQERIFPELFKLMQEILKTCPGKTNFDIRIVPYREEGYEAILDLNLIRIRNCDCDKIGKDSKELIDFFSFDSLKRNLPTAYAAKNNKLMFTPDALERFSNLYIRHFKNIYGISEESPCAPMKKFPDEIEKLTKAIEKLPKWPTDIDSPCWEIKHNEDYEDYDEEEEMEEISIAFISPIIGLPIVHDCFVRLFKSNGFEIPKNRCRFTSEKEPHTDNYGDYTGYDCFENYADASIRVNLPK